MGAGKTTIGRQLARLTGKTFYDSDHEIEARTGVRIPVIFEIEGEAGFRVRESEMIAELATLPNIVLATGGGAVLDVLDTHASRREVAHRLIRAVLRDDGDAQPPAVARDGRHLVAQALAAARGHQHQGIAPLRHMFHDGLLRPAKGGIAKDIVQDSVNGGH